MRSTLDTVAVYLDHAATTPIRAEVLDAMAKVHEANVSNPSSRHRSGRDARRMLDDARDEIAELVGFAPSEIVFTSGGTEADDLAIHGIAPDQPGLVLCSAVEHEAVLAAVDQRGGQTMGVDASGRVDVDKLAETLQREHDTNGVALVSVMLVNNENGVVQPIEAVANVLHKYAPGTPLHSDAVQAASWMDLPSALRNVDAASLSAHKIGGPVGVGVLGVRKHVPFRARVPGGGQENERRGGTQNLAGAVGLACALRLANLERAETLEQITALRDDLVAGILTQCAGVLEPAAHDGVARPSGGIAQLCIEGVESEALLFLLDEAYVEASAGSACAAGALEPSHVLTAMGVPESLAKGALRLSVGRTTTRNDIDRAQHVIVEAIHQLRGERNT